MQVPILHGIYTDSGADFRTSYPLNLIPVPKEQGISKGYLRTAEGMVEFANSIYSGSSDRGALTWDGIQYRVIGDWLTRVNADGTIDYLGNVANDGNRVVMVYGFDRMAIASSGLLYYWSQAIGLVQVTDPDVGIVRDVIWAAGYYMVTDGEFIAQSELTDPTSFNPLKYGSSEASPDPVNSLLYIRNEMVAVNRFTCEIFQNVGGDGFAWQRIEGAIIPKGSLTRDASCYFIGTFAFVGGGDGESLSVYIAGAGETQKVATREIETILGEYTPDQVATIVLEPRADKLQQLLYLHLPDKTLVYDAAGSATLGDPIWFVLASGSNAELPYRARNLSFAYGKWLFGDLQSLRIGYLTSDDARQFGETVPWQFDTVLVYNESKGAIVNNLELVRLPGRQAVNPLISPPTQLASIFASYTEDGLTWSNPKPSVLTSPGMTQARTTWRRLGKFRQYRGMRFRGMNNPYPDAFARLEADLEPLNY